MLKLCQITRINKIKYPGKEVKLSNKDPISLNKRKQKANCYWKDIILIKR